MLSFLHRLPQQFVKRLSQALPSSCALCGSDGEHGVCAGCREQFFTRHPVRCVRCAIALPHAFADPHAVCGDCLKSSRSFDASIVATDYAAPVDQMVLALKFGGQLALAPLFAQLLHEAWQRSAPTRDMQPSLLLPVPLGTQRLIDRGFNQAQEIARPLAQSLGIPLLPRAAMRVRDTAAQSSLSPDERRKNMRRAFTVAPGMIDRVKGKHVGIVDDVMTTGETLDELAATLKRFGAARVTNFVFARSPH